MLSVIQKYGKSIRVKDIRMILANTFSMLCFYFAVLLFSGIAFGLSITFVDVGHGDCVVMEDETVLVVVDCGDSQGGEALEKLLLEKGRKIDILFITHPHPDHFFGAANIKELISTDFIYWNGDVYDHEDYYSTLESLKNAGKILKTTGKGDKFNFEDFSIEVIHPDSDFLEKSNDLNDRSLVMMVSKGKKRMLLTADITAEAQKYLLESYKSEDLAADIMKMPHHCSKKAFSEEFVRAVAPRAVIISTGPSEYNYPDEDCINSIGSSVPVVLRTDKEGSISLIW